MGSFRNSLMKSLRSSGFVFYRKEKKNPKLILKVSQFICEHRQVGAVGKLCHIEDYREENLQRFF